MTRAQWEELHRLAEAHGEKGEIEPDLTDAQAEKLIEWLKTRGEGGKGQPGPVKAPEGP